MLHPPLCPGGRGVGGSGGRGAVVYIDWCINHFSLSFFLDFSHRRPPPVSDHFVEHQGWSLTRELSYTMLLLFLMFVTAVCVLFFFYISSYLIKLQVFWWSNRELTGEHNIWGKIWHLKPIQWPSLISMFLKLGGNINRYLISGFLIISIVLFCFVFFNIKWFLIIVKFVGVDQITYKNGK